VLLGDVDITRHQIQRRIAEMQRQQAEVERAQREMLGRMYGGRS
jgi:hypothetical protein